MKEEWANEYKEMRERSNNEYAISLINHSLKWIENGNASTHSAMAIRIH